MRTAAVSLLFHAAVMVSACLSAPPGDLRRTPVVEVFEKTRDSIVNISSTSTTIRYMRSPFGLGMFDDIFEVPTESTSLGSGFLIHKNGYIITNAHVLARAAEHKVTLSTGEDYEADLVASDPERDLAVLKVEPKPGQTLKPIKLGRSDDLMIGETVIAIGNPVGLRHTLTTGVISALHRDVEFAQDVVYRDLIQTDASINPGNSGGPLLNVYGDLIGVNTAIRGDAQNIGFAIPVDKLREVLPDMLDAEKRYRLDVGMKLSGRGTVRVASLREGGQAQKAGLRVDDVLLSVDGTPVEEAVDFPIALLGHAVGDKLRLEVRRGDQKHTVEMTLRNLPPPDGATLAYKLYGMKLASLSHEKARQLGIRRITGLLVTEVDRDSPADRSGIRPGDVLVQLGRMQARDLESVGQDMEGIQRDEARYIRILRFHNRGADAYEGQINAR